MIAQQRKNSEDLALLNEQKRNADEIMIKA
jgi:hypothetical protein